MERVALNDKKRGTVKRERVRPKSKRALERARERYRELSLERYDSIKIEICKSDSLAILLYVLAEN